jgi:hypothetical protein
VRTSARIAVIWVGALVIAFILRAALPRLPGIFVTGRVTGRVYSLNIVVFWICIIVGFTIGLIVALQSRTR